jgi:tetratricopeptide (TPR) repeat protein
MNNNITPEMLIRYMDNELTAEERLQVEKELATDPEASEQLRKLQVAKQALKQYARKEQVAAIRKEMMQEGDMASATLHQSDHPAKVRWLRTTLRAAAVIILLVVVAGIVQYSLLDNERLYRTQYQSFSLGTARAENKTSQIEEAFRRKDYQAVISFYRQSDSAAATDNFIAGQAFLATDNAANAIAAFEKQLAINSSLDFKPYQDDTEYYLALAYLKAGDVNKALPLFRKINTQSSHAYHREVSSWYLTKLEWLERKQK